MPAVLPVRRPRQAECRSPRPLERRSYGLSQHVGLNAIEAPGCGSAMKENTRRSSERPPGGPSVTLALHALAQQLAVAPNRLGLFPRPSLRGFLVIAPKLHFSEHPLALHFLLQGSQCLIDVVVANEDLHGGVSPLLDENCASRSCGQAEPFLASSMAAGKLAVPFSGALLRIALPPSQAATYFSHDPLEDRKDGASRPTNSRRPDRRSNRPLGTSPRRGHD